jgi:LCP family protein required for cell wall assembly
MASTWRIARASSAGVHPAAPIRNAMLGLMACAAVLALLLGTGVLYVEHRLTRNIDRIDGVFEGLDNRPRVPDGPAADAVNILLMGTDRRSSVATTGDDAAAPAWLPGAQRSDSLMLVHIDADRRGATVVSLPRDSWVAVRGYGMAKVNAAFSYGGPSLAVQTVEDLTGVRIDHLAVVDWAGFRELTDAVGGVTVTVPQTVHDQARGVTWTAGQHVLDGQEALDYVGQRYGLPQGDLDRVRRQQYLLGALLEASLHQEMRTNPSMVLDFLDTVTNHLSVDDEWTSHDMARLALSLRSLRSADIRYLTAPVEGLGWEGAQSVVHLDAAKDAALWRAMRQDRMTAWFARHPGSIEPAPPR